MALALIRVLAAWLLLSPAGCSEDGGPADGDGDADSDADADSDSDTDADGDSDGDADGDSSAGPGHVTYRVADGHVFRIEAREGAAPEDVSAALDALSAGEDEWASPSADGEWLLLGTERFGCEGWACLALASSDLATAEAVRDGLGELVRAGVSAVSSGARQIVYPLSDGDRVDLWSIERSGSGWGSPVLLTASSPFAFNESPRFDAAGERLVFHCGPVPYGQEGSSVCEVRADGTGLRVAVGPEDGPGGSPDRSVRSPDFAPDGSLVFEADWNGEQIWRLAAAGGEPVVVGADFSNDNSPCVLPDGRVVSLWLGRPGSGIHEIKVMGPTGLDHFMLLIGEDVADIGIGCSL